MTLGRICFLANLGALHAVRWANHFHQRGYEVHIISLREGDGLLEGIHVHRLRENLPFKLDYFRGVRQVRELVADIRPSIVHAHYASGYGTLGRLVGFHPYIVSVWGSDIYEFPHRSPLHKWLLRRNLAAADYLCSTSQDMAREAKQYTLKPILITPFGVDCDEFSIPNTWEQSNEFVIGTVRSMEKSYGIDCLLKAFKLLVNEHSDWPIKLVIVGGGNLEREYRELARDLGLGGLVHFAGKVSHRRVPDYLRSFSVFAALSDNESFGVAILEASSCGIPVVVSKVGGLPEVVVDGKTGLMVPPDDEVAAAKCFEKLYLSPSLRDSLGRAGRQRVKQRYEWSQTARIMENLYERVIATNTSEPAVHTAQKSAAAAV
ncbi:MAG TPA: glycosyltransferase [Candidatus Sulfotelmatobacter sp.]|jgi:L-malate glycosyltransferase|nr:glycosyltransferase [Candidatus Sulfotelmatobacter sp.]